MELQQAEILEEDADGEVGKTHVFTESNNGIGQECFHPDHTKELHEGSAHHLGRECVDTAPNALMPDLLALPLISWASSAFMMTLVAAFASS